MAKRPYNELIQLIDEVIFTNDQQLIKALFENALLKDIVESVYPEASAVTQDQMVWVSTTTYYPNDNLYRYWNGKLYQFVADEFNVGTEPGTDESVWKEVPFSELTHPQNSDYKIEDYAIVVNPSVGSLDMSLSANRKKNQIQFYNPSLLPGIIPFTINCKGPREGDVIKHPIKVIVPTGMEFTVSFSNDLNQYVGGTSLQLSAGHFAVFKYEDSPNGGRLRLQYSSISKETSPENPFNQELNTTNTPTFVGAALTSLIGTIETRMHLAIANHLGQLIKNENLYLDGTTLSLPGNIKFQFSSPDGKVLVLNSGNQIVPTEGIAIEDVVFSQIRIINQTTGLPEIWQVVGTEFVKVA